MITTDNVNSFTIDHTKLKPGVYIAREGNGFTTYDLRVTEPNKEPAMAPAAAHSLEHLLATWFRNCEIKDHVVAVDGMLCMTGLYLILDYKASVLEVRDLLLRALKWIEIQKEVPAAKPEMCGNYLLHDLPMCKWEAKRYLTRLSTDFHSEYTKLDE